MTAWLQTTAHQLLLTGAPASSSPVCWLAVLNSLSSSRVLLVTAHPDDEVMFFAPLLQWLSQMPQVQLHILCLSTGNFNGLGNTRREELAQCGAVFHIPRERIAVVNHPALQDGMDNTWAVDVVSSLVEEHVQMLKVTMLFTFDDYGVSGHPNHIATYHGVRHALVKMQSSPHSDIDISGFALNSRSLIRKYCGALDMILCVLFDENVLLTWSLAESMRGMRAHYSQMVWFRVFFIFFSCYSYANSFRTIT